VAERNPSEQQCSSELLPMQYKFKYTNVILLTIRTFPQGLGKSRYFYDQQRTYRVLTQSCNNMHFFSKMIFEILNKRRLGSPDDKQPKI